MTLEYTAPRTLYLMFAAWFISLVATAGSLFFSEVMSLPPCVLCWYQRIAMYPLTIIFLVGLFPLNKQAIRFAIPLVAIGWLIAVYHNLLYYHFLPESSSPCVKGISCTTVQLEWLGFITIPMMSLVAFSLLIVVMLGFYQEKRS